MHSPRAVLPPRLLPHWWPGLAPGVCKAEQRPVPASGVRGTDRHRTKRAPGAFKVFFPCDSSQGTCSVIAQHPRHGEGTRGEEPFYFCKLLATTTLTLCSQPLACEAPCAAVSCRSGEAEQQGGDSYGIVQPQVPIVPISHWPLSSGLRSSTSLRALQQGTGTQGRGTDLPDSRGMQLCRQ